MSDTYLIPQFIIDYLKKSKSTKNPQNLASASLQKNKTPEIEQWFKENEVTAGYIWKYFVFYGLNKFSFRECPVCGKRVKLENILKRSNTKFCSKKCISKFKEVREKRKQTCLAKYGVDYYSKTKEYKEKYKQTCLERYGVENLLQNKEVQEKYKQTNLSKYGVAHFLASKEIQEKIFKTNRSDYWETFCVKLKEKNIVPLFSKEEYIKDTGRKFKCLICGEEFISEGTCESLQNRKRNKCVHSLLSVQHIYCPHCFKARYSKKEKEVAEFVKSIYNGEVFENHKGLFPNKNMELDIFIPALNLGIEFDGTYWHSFEDAQERDTIKTKLCEEKGIRLIRIKEKDWDTHKEKVKEEIKKYIL